VKRQLRIKYQIFRLLLQMQKIVLQMQKSGMKNGLFLQFLAFRKNLLH